MYIHTRQGRDRFLPPGCQTSLSLSVLKRLCLSTSSAHSFLYYLSLSFNPLEGYPPSSARMALATVNRVMGPVISVAEVAGNFGVPYIGGIATLARGIQDSCEKVVVHRVSMLDTLSIQSSIMCRRKNAKILPEKQYPCSISSRSKLQ